MAVRTKTRRRLQILLLAALALTLLGSGGYVLRKRQVAARILNGRDLGYAALQAGDHFTALHKIGPYLQRHPDDPEALHKYAEARMKVEEPNGKHLADAMSLYRRLLELQPDNEPAREELLDLYLLVNFNAEVLSRTDGRDDAVSLRTRAVALLRTGRAKEALAASQRHNELKPSDLRIQSLTLQLMTAEGETPGAVIEHATALQKAHPDDPIFELLLANAFAMAQDRERALAWTRKAAARRLDDPELLDAAVELLDALGLYGESLQVLRQKAEVRSEPDFQRRLARRLYQSGHWTDAARHLAPLTEDATKADVELLAHRALALQAADDHASAARIVDSLAARKGERSAAVWADVLAVVPQKDALPDDDRIITACREGLKTLPENPYFRLYLGDAFARLGEAELAVHEWQNAARFAPAWPVPKARLARLLIASRRPELLDAADSLARVAENDADSLAVAAWARATAQPKPTAEQADALLHLADKVQALRRGEPLSLRLKIHVLSQTSGKDAARSAVAQYLAAQPSLPREALLALAGASEAAELGLEDACFEQCAKASGSSSALAMARAARLARGGKHAEAIQTFTTSRSAAADADSIGWQLAWAQLNDAVDDPAAPKVWSDLAAAHPNSPLVQVAVMSAQSVRTERDLVRRAIDRVGNVVGNEGVTWRIADARWTLQGAVARATAAEREQDLVKAASVLNEVVRRHPENAQARLLLGESLVQLGKKDAAVEHLTAAANAMPNSWPVALQLASLLQSLGDFEAARPYLEHAEQLLERAAQAEALESSAPAPADAQPAGAAQPASASATATTNLTNEAAWRTLAALYGARGETDRAVKILSRAGAAGRPGVDLALFELHRRAGTLDDAMCQKLLAEPTPAAIGLVADFYAASGRSADAQRTIALLDSVKSDPGEREFIRGVYLQRAGAIDKAIEQLRAACDAAPQNAQAWRALITLLLNAKQIDPAVVAAGRAAHAVPNDGGFKRIVEQHDLLRGTADVAPARGLAVSLVGDDAHADVAIDGLRLVRDAYAHKETVAQVSTKLRPLADRAASFAPLQNLLIDLYMAQRDFDGAWTLATRLAQLSPADPAPARRAAEALAAAGKWDQVIGAARAWRDRSGAATREPDEMLATAYLATGDFPAAERQLAPYREPAAGDPAAWVTCVALYAQALIAQGRIAEAREYVSPTLPVNAALREAWITTGVRAIRDTGAASEWIDAVKPFVPSESVDEHLLLASARVQLARRPGADDAARREALAAVAEADAKAKTAPGATAEHWATLGALREMIDEPAGAEADYRNALRLDPRHAIAQNNLAMLILRRGGDLNEARDLATGAASNADHPAAAEILDTLAQVQSKLGRHDAAADALRRAALLQPDNLAMRVGLVEALLDAGKPAEARDSLTEVEELLGRMPSVDPEQSRRIDQVRQRLSSVPGN